MAAWPGSLPAAPLLDEFEYDPADQCTFSEMDTGPPQRRRRFSVAYGRYTMAFILTGTQRATFETFYVTTMAGGSSTISGFADPRDGSTATFQFAPRSVPQWRPLSPSAAAASMLWHVRMVWDRVA